KYGGSVVSFVDLLLLEGLAQHARQIVGGNLQPEHITVLRAVRVRLRADTGVLRQFVPACEQFRQFFEQLRFHNLPRNYIVYEYRAFSVSQQVDTGIRRCRQPRMNVCACRVLLRVRFPARPPSAMPDYRPAHKECRQYRRKSWRRRCRPQKTRIVRLSQTQSENSVRQTETQDRPQPYPSNWLPNG